MKIGKSALLIHDLLRRAATHFTESAQERLTERINNPQTFAISGSLAARR